PGTQFETVDENGQTGTYRITSVEPQGAEPGPSGLVVVTSYFDAETGSPLSASGSGTGGLGSEAGHVFDQNGALVSSFNSGQAADAPAGTPVAPQPEPPQGGEGPPTAEEPPPTEEPQPEPPQGIDGANDVLFTYTYEYGNGDFYEGFGYVDESAGIQPGQVIADTGPNETGETGFWTITGTEAQGQDLGNQGMVFVRAYSDADTGVVSPATGSGAFGLGSETGTLADGADVT
ncbi:MAG: hypothetical protein HQL39_20670, partial [Alphaproteobacteria bacterium]|nr:hypothetical protein [Alphaproteobacteria bacterium]